jgi:hypothetical protein
MLMQLAGLHPQQKQQWAQLLMEQWAQLLLQDVRDTFSDSPALLTGLACAP